MATLLPVPSHSTAPRAKANFKAHLLPEALAPERHPTSAPSGTRKGKPSSWEQLKLRTRQAPVCDPRREGSLERQGPPGSRGPDSGTVLVGVRGWERLAGRKRICKWTWLWGPADRSRTLSHLAIMTSPHGAMPQHSGML